MEISADQHVSQILRLLFGNEPFFGKHSFAIRGDSRRHIYLIAAVYLAAPASRPMTVLEIGSQTGSSTLSIAQAMRKFSSAGGSITCVDTWEPSSDLPFGMPDGRSERTLDPRSIDSTDMFFNLFAHNTMTIAGDIRVIPVRGKSSETLPSLSLGSYDLIYVNGSHYYDDVLFDLRWSDYLLCDGGILCGDDPEFVESAADAVSESQSSYPGIARSSPTYAYPGVALATSHFFGRNLSSIINFWIARKRTSSYEDVSLFAIPSLIPNHFPDWLKIECRARFGKPG